MSNTDGHGHYITLSLTASDVISPSDGVRFSVTSLPVAESLQDENCSAATMVERYRSKRPRDTVTIGRVQDQSFEDEEFEHRASCIEVALGYCCQMDWNSTLSVLVACSTNRAIKMATTVLHLGLAGIDAHCVT